MLSVVGGILFLAGLAEVLRFGILLKHPEALMILGLGVMTIAERIDWLRRTFI